MVYQWITLDSDASVSSILMFQVLKYRIGSDYLSCTTLFYILFYPTRSYKGLSNITWFQSYVIYCVTLKTIVLCTLKEYAELKCVCFYICINPRHFQLCCMQSKNKGQNYFLLIFLLFVCDTNSDFPLYVCLILSFPYSSQKSNEEEKMYQKKKPTQPFSLAKFQGRNFQDLEIEGRDA